MPLQACLLAAPDCKVDPAFALLVESLEPQDTTAPPATRPATAVASNLLNSRRTMNSSAMLMTTTTKTTTTKKTKTYAHGTLAGTTATSSVPAPKPRHALNLGHFSDACLRPRFQGIVAVVSAADGSERCGSFLSFLRARVAAGRSSASTSRDSLRTSPSDHAWNGQPRAR